jgi:hypothetical protein
VVVAEGVTVAVPCGNAHGLHTALPEASITVIEFAVPLDTCHAKVDDRPGAIVLGLAVRVKVKGTQTVTGCGPALPPGPIAVSEKVVVALTGTTADPETGSGPESSVTGIAGVIVTDVALVVFQVRVVV